MPIYISISIPKDRLSVFTKYPSVTKYQALEETVLTLFPTVVYAAVNPLVPRIQLLVTMSSKANIVKMYSMGLIFIMSHQQQKSFSIEFFPNYSNTYCIC